MLLRIDCKDLPRPLRGSRSITMRFSFSEASSIATALVVSELKSSLCCAAANTLAASFPDNFYLVCELPVIPPFYYQFPSVASMCEQELTKAREELYSLGTKLGILPERCLLLPRYYPHFSKLRLQRHLVRRLKCPVRLLTMARNEPWLYTVGLSLTNSCDMQLARKKHVEGIVKIRYLASSC